MKTVRTLMLVLIVAISLSGLTSLVQAAEDAKTPVAPVATDAPAAPTATDVPAAPAAPAATDGPAITADDNVTGGDSKDGASSGTGGTTTTQPAAPPGLFDNKMMLYAMGAMLLMFIFMGRGKRKTEKKRKAMLAQLQKGDKVTTIGGIVGTVLEVRDDEVTVKIDESSNTRMRFARWAVRGVGVDAKTAEPDEKK